MKKRNIVLSLLIVTVMVLLMLPAPITINSGVLNIADFALPVNPAASPGAAAWTGSGILSIAPFGISTHVRISVGLRSDISTPPKIVYSDGTEVYELFYSPVRRCYDGLVPANTYENILTKLTVTNNTPAVITYGDLNADGIVNTKDVKLATAYCRSISLTSDDVRMFLSTDVSGNSVSNEDDARMIQDFYLNRISDLTINTYTANTPSLSSFKILRNTSDITATTVYSSLGSSIQLTASALIFGSAQYNGPYAWSSSTANASVDSTGRATMLQEGTAVITASAFGSIVSVTFYIDEEYVNILTYSDEIMEELNDRANWDETVRKGKQRGINSWFWDSNGRPHNRNMITVVDKYDTENYPQGVKIGEKSIMFDITKANPASTPSSHPTCKISFNAFLGTSSTARVYTVMYWVKGVGGTQQTAANGKLNLNNFPTDISVNTSAMQMDTLGWRKTLASGDSTTYIYDSVANANLDTSNNPILKTSLPNQVKLANPSASNALFVSGEWMLYARRVLVPVNDDGGRPIDVMNVEINLDSPNLLDAKYYFDGFAIFEGAKLPAFFDNDYDDASAAVIPPDFDGWIESNGKPFNETVQNNSGWNLVINTPDSSETYAFARSDAEYLIRAVTPTAPQKAGIFTINFINDSAIPTYSFKWTSVISGNNFTLNCYGSRPIDALDAFYSAMEEMGYRFEVVGPMIPSSLNYTAVSSNKTVNPDVLRRGIREHINFPMDISSYPLGEAKEYIRNLARLRFNYITFHSYPGHWTREKWVNMSAFGVFMAWVGNLYSPLDTETFGGAFFYGDKFDIPDYPLVKDNIRFNTTDFCFPEMEPYYYQYQYRTALGREWLREIMLESKRVGMDVQLSTEIKNCYDKYTDSLCDRILEDYPMIDCLELISRETGEGLLGPYATELERYDAYIRNIVDAPAEQSYELDSLFKNDNNNPTILPPIKDFAFNMRLINNLKARSFDAEHNIRLAFGFYVCDSQELKLCAELTTRFLPSDVLFTIMPAHSSARVYENYIAAQIPAVLKPKMQIYSWLEFDGFMYLSQFSGTGIYNIVNSVNTETSAPMFALMTNHWRNAENYMSFRYQSEVSLNKNITPQSFCDSYSDYMGLNPTDKTAFRTAMMNVDALSFYSAFPGNVAFCIKDTYAVNPATRYVGSVWWWGAGEMQSGATKYGANATTFAALANKVSNPGVKRLLLLMEATNMQAKCHLEGMILLKDCTIRHTNGTMPATLTTAEMNTIITKTNQAEVKFVEYMNWLTRDMIDRGVEGTLINYYYGPLLYANNIRAVFGGLGEYIDLNSDGHTVPQPLT